MKKFSFVIIAVMISTSTFTQWAHIPSPTTNRLYDITFRDSLVGFIAGLDVILRTTDGGSDWNIVYSENMNEPVAEVYFPKGSTGYAVSDYHILKTTNGGDTWYSDSSPDYFVLRGVYFLNPDTGFVCGQGQTIYRTVNGGFSWTRQTEGIYWLRRFDFPTKDIGFCVGDGQTVYKTTDGGETWDQIYEGYGPNLTDVQFKSPDTGYVCGLYGYAAVTYDGGYTWNPLNTGASVSLEGLFALDPQTIYVVGGNGYISKTTDGGSSWSQDNSGADSTLREAFFLENKGFIVGYGGTILTNNWCTKAMFAASIDSLTVAFTDESECAVSWYWSFGDGYFSALQHPVYTYDSAGLYNVCLTVTDTVANFSDTYCQELLITSLNDPANDPAMLVYPNPSSDYIIIPSRRDNPVVGIEIYDARGVKVLDQKIQDADNSTEAGLKIPLQLPGGFYVVAVQDKDGPQRIGKVIVK